MGTKKPLIYNTEIFLNAFDFTDPFRYPVPKIYSFLEKKQISNSNNSKRVSPQKSSKVERIQIVLKKYGFYEGKIDGILGKKNTRKGIREFQQMLKDKGLYDIRVDGIWGRKTQSGLNTLRKIESAEEVTNTFGPKVKQDLLRRTPIESRPVFYSKITSKLLQEKEPVHVSGNNTSNYDSTKATVNNDFKVTDNASQTTNSNATTYPKATYFTDNNSTIVRNSYTDPPSAKQTNKSKQTNQVSEPKEASKPQTDSSATNTESGETINHGPITRVKDGDKGMANLCALWQNSLLRKSGYDVSGDAWRLNNVTVLLNGYSSLNKPRSSNIAEIKKFNDLARDAFARNFDIDTLDKHKVYIINIANNNSRFLRMALQQGNKYYGTHTALVVYENGQWVAKHSWGRRVRVEPLKDILDNKRSYGITAISTPNS